MKTFLPIPRRLPKVLKLGQHVKLFNCLNRPCCLTWQPCNMAIVMSCSHFWLDRYKNWSFQLHWWFLSSLPNVVHAIFSLQRQTRRNGRPEKKTSKWLLDFQLNYCHATDIIKYLQEMITLADLFIRVSSWGKIHMPKSVHFKETQ